MLRSDSVRVGNLSERLKSLRNKGLRDDSPSYKPPASPLPLPPTPARDADAVVADTLREWNSILMKLLKSQKYDTYEKVKRYYDALNAIKKREEKPSFREIEQMRLEVDAVINAHHARADSQPRSESRPSSPLSTNSSSILEVFKNHALADGSFWSSSTFVSCSEPSQQPGLDSAYHVYFNLKACIASICSPGETSELYFSVYNKTRARFITESYFVRMTNNGMPKDEEKIGKLKTIFCEITKADMTNELWLVCKIVRHGRLLPSENMLDDSSIGCPLRRPFGYAVLSLTEILGSSSSQEDQDHLMRIYTALHETSFPSLLDNILNKNGGYETSARAETICVGVDLYYGKLDVILRDNFSYVRYLEVTPRIGFPEIIFPGDERNSMYIQLVAGEFTQGRKTSAKNIEIRIQGYLSNGQPIGNCFFKGTGEASSDCFESLVFYHNNSPRWLETVRLDFPIKPDGFFLVFYLRHCSSNDSRSSNADKSDKTFGFCFLNLLTKDDTIVPDEEHILNIYKYDRRVMPEVLQNLNNATSLEDLKVGILGKDRMIIKTELCSTQMTQNISLMKLLKWKNNKSEDMRSILKNFTFIGPMEIIKYLQDILHTLFEILQDCCDGKLTNNLHDADIPHLVFSALVFVLNIIITDRRFTNFKGILELYVREHFTKNNVSSVWRSLLSSMNYFSSNLDDPVLAKELRSTLKATEFLIMLIVKSWISAGGLLDLDHQSELKENVVIFYQRLARLFESSAKAEVSIGAQILVLQNLAASLSELIPTNIFRPIELAQIVNRFIDSVQNNDKRKVLEMKLILCHQIIKKDYFRADPEPRKAIIDGCAGLITYCLETFPELLQQINRLLMEIVACDCLSELNILELFPKILDSYLRFKKRLSIQVELTEDALVLDTEFSVCILSIVESLEDEKLEALFRGSKMIASHSFKLLSVWLKDETDLNGSVIEISSKSITSRSSRISDMDGSMTRKKTPVLNFRKVGPFPDNWQSIIRRFHVLCLKYIKFLTSAVDKEHWNEWWPSLLTKLLHLFTLADEIKLSLDVCKSLDISGSHILRTIWKNKDILMKSPIFIKCIMELTCLSQFSEAQSYAVQIISDSLCSEVTNFKNMDSSKSFIDTARTLTPLQVEIIGQLDRLVMNLGKCDIYYKNWLLDRLQKKLSRQYSNFINSVEHFLSLTIYIRSRQNTQQSDVTEEGGIMEACPMGDPENADNPILKSQSDDLALLLSHLLHFTALLDRKQMYVKYIHSLFTLHIKESNWIEAAFTLKKHCDLYSWKIDDLIDELHPGFNLTLMGSSISIAAPVLEGMLTLDTIRKLSKRQSSFERRETLTHLMIYLLIQAQYFEKAMEFLKEIVEKYETITFEFDKVSKCFKIMSDLSLKVQDVDRFYPSYFRVAFVGKGWLAHFKAQNKFLLDIYGLHFVQKGKEWETLSEFIDRMMLKLDESEVGDIKILKQNNYPPSPEYLDSDEKYLQVCKVDPIPDTNSFSAQLKGSNAPDRVKNYFQNNWTKKFSFSRPFKKNTLSEKIDNLFPPKSVENDLLSLWCESYDIETEEIFPNFLKVSKIKSCVRKEISPIENAISLVNHKNIELGKLEKDFKKILHQSSVGPKKKQRNSNLASLNCINVNPLTMSLNGAIDAPVNGGIPLYKRVFFIEEYLNLFPGDQESVKNLKACIDEQVIIISRLLPLHQILVTNEMKPLHEQLEILFRKNYEQELLRLSL